MRPIRTAARALIIHEDKLLAIKMRDQSGIFYILPGGGQRHGETLKQGLERECLEEIGTRVEVGELLYVREYIGRNHEFRHAHRAFHQLETVFRCTPPRSGGHRSRQRARQKQIGVEWILEGTTAMPLATEHGETVFFRNRLWHPTAITWGDVN